MNSEKKKLEASLNANTWVSKTKEYYGKTIASKKELTKALQRKPRIAIWFIKYWRAVAAVGIPLAVLITWMGANAYIAWNFPSIEEMSGVIIVVAIIASMVALGVYSFFMWIRKYENEFDDLWLAELGMLTTEKQKLPFVSYEQHFEDIATEMCKNIVENPRYKKLLDPKYKEGVDFFAPTGTRSKLFHIDIMRREARKYFFTYWLPVELARQATLLKMNERQARELEKQLNKNIKAAMEERKGEQEWLENADQEKNKKEVNLNEEQQIPSNSNENLQSTDATISDSDSSVCNGDV